MRTICPAFAILLQIVLGIVGCGGRNVLEDPSGRGAHLPNVQDRGGNNFEVAQLLERNAWRTLNESERETLLLQAMAYYRLGLEQVSDQAAAHQRYQNLLERFGKTNPAFIHRLRAEYSRWYREHSGSPLFASLYARALVTSGTRADMDEAQRIIGVALAESPDDYWLNLRMGVIALIRVDLDVALKHLAHAFRQGSALRQYEAARLLGQLYVQLGHLEAAAEPLLLVLQQDPMASIDEYEAAASVLMKLGRFAAAETILLQDLPPETAAISKCRHLRLVGELYQRQRKWQAAATAYRTYLRLNPEAADRHEIAWRLADVEAAAEND